MGRLRLRIQHLGRLRKCCQCSRKSCQVPCNTPSSTTPHSCYGLRVNSLSPDPYSHPRIESMLIWRGGDCKGTNSRPGLGPNPTPATATATAHYIPPHRRTCYYSQSQPDSNL